MAGFHHAVNIITLSPIREIAYTTPGTYTFVVPTGIYTVSAVYVGGGSSGEGTVPSTKSSGAGGGLGWKNNIQVTPGKTYTIVVGAGGYRAAGVATSFSGGTSSCFGYQAFGGTLDGVGGGYTGDGGGNGGNCGGNAVGYPGGGGAGGYAGNGGNGGNNSNGGDGVGGAAGGGASGSGPGAGAGVGIYGQGANGAGGVKSASGWPVSGAGGGSGGTNASASITPGQYGGGAGGLTSTNHARGGEGAVRVLWGRTANGDARSFPSTNVGVI